MTDQPTVPPWPEEPRPAPPPPPPPVIPQPTPAYEAPQTATAVIPPDMPPPVIAPPRGGFGRFGRLMEENPWTNVYGLGRTIIATATILTLATTNPDAMWSPFFEGSAGPLGCDGIRGAISFFCVVPVDYLDIAHRTAILVLLLVASGWRPRVTGILHWYISFSILASATRDGGDQVAALVTLFLIPWTLTDPREWHWQRAQAVGARTKHAFVANAARMIIRLQIMVVYLHSAVTKFNVDEWLDGTAVYYWFHDPIVGASQLLEPLLFPAARSPVVYAMTWGAIVVEIVLVIGLVVPRRFWRPLFWLGVLFHLGIALGLGLFSFSVIMIGALVIYLRAPEKEFGRLLR